MAPRTATASPSDRGHLTVGEVVRRVTACGRAESLARNGRLRAGYLLNILRQRLPRIVRARISAEDDGGDVLVSLDGDALLRINQDGRLVWRRPGVAPPGHTPAVGTREFVAGRRRFEKIAAATAACRSAALRAPCGRAPRSRQPRARSRTSRTPRSSRAGPSDGGSDGSGDEGPAGGLITRHPIWALARETARSGCPGAARHRRSASTSARRARSLSARDARMSVSTACESCGATKWEVNSSDPRADRLPTGGAA